MALSSQRWWASCQSEEARGRRSGGGGGPRARRTGPVNLNLGFVEERCSFPLTAQILEVIGTLKCEELSPPITSGRPSAAPVCQGNVHGPCLSGGTRAFCDRGGLGSVGWGYPQPSRSARSRGWRAGLTPQDRGRLIAQAAPPAAFPRLIPARGLISPGARPLKRLPAKAPEPRQLYLGGGGCLQAGFQSYPPQMEELKITAPPALTLC